jgi:hypothetical protein
MAFDHDDVLFILLAGIYELERWASHTAVASLDFGVFWIICTEWLELVGHFFKVAMERSTDFPT